MNVNSLLGSNVKSGRYIPTVRSNQLPLYETRGHIYQATRRRNQTTVILIITTVRTSNVISRQEFMISSNKTLERMVYIYSILRRVGYSACTIYLNKALWLLRTKTPVAL
jgi:hypothetical protein